MPGRSDDLFDGPEESFRPRGHRSSPSRPWRAGVLLVVGFALGVLLVSKSQPIALTRSTAPDISAPGGTTTLPGTPSTSSSTTGLPAPKSPSSVKVVVANGTGTSGAAGRIAAELGTDGYKNYTAANATSPVKVSAVFYASGYEGNAAAIAAFLGLQTPIATMPSSPPVSSSIMHGADILVMVGPDLASSTTSPTSG